MDIKLYIYYVLLIILLVLLYFMFNYYLLALRNSKIHKRLNRYSVTKPKKEERIFDNIIYFYDNLIKKISKRLYKVKFLVKYSYKYSKYINKYNENYIDKMDFISRKFLIGFWFLLCVFVYDLMKIKVFNVNQLIMSYVIGFFVLDILLISKNKILKKQQENDLLKSITIMNNSFKSGKSIMQAIEIVSKEIDSPIGLEFKKMYIDLNYGLSLDVVFKRFEERVKIEDAKYITTSLNILNSTGGDIVKVFESVERTFFNNKKLKEELNNLTASSKFLFYVLLFIPIIFVLIIYLLDNQYFNPFFSSIIGLIVLFICIILYTSYIFIIKKILGGINERGS